MFVHLHIGALTSMLRDLVLMRMGRCGDEATVAEARKRFEEHCAGTKTLSADLRSTVSDNSGLSLSQFQGTLLNTSRYPYLDI